jgi:hypothetical protein
MQSRERVSPNQDQVDALRKGCDSDDIDSLQRLVETFQAKLQDVRMGFWIAIDRNRAKMVRYLLKQGVDQVDAYALERALKASAIEVLDVMKEFGWSDVNMCLREVGSLSSGGAVTALL